MVACPPILEEDNSSSVGRGTAFPHSREGERGWGPGVSSKGMSPVTRFF